MSNQEPVVMEQTVETEETSQPTSPEISSSVAEAPVETTSPEEVEAISESSEDSTAEPLSIHNLKIGQHLTGKVKNIADFGAFVDIGIAQDGLVHISELAKRKVEKVTDVVSQGQEVDVWVKKVDKKRGRISLTMIKPISRKLKDIDEGAELEGVVTRLESYGAFVDIGSDRDGLVHISQITHDYIKHPEEALAVGDKVTVKVLQVNRKKRQVDLSIKALLPAPPPSEEVKVVEEVKKEEVKAAKKVEEELELSEDEPMPTAMAIAYAALQGELQAAKESKESSVGKGKSKRKKEIDAIVARTLASRQ